MVSLRKSATNARHSLHSTGNMLTKVRHYQAPVAPRLTHRAHLHSSLWLAVNYLLPPWLETCACKSLAIT